MHLRPSGLLPQHLAELRSNMLKLDFPFSVSFSTDFEGLAEQIGEPIKQVWFYSPKIDKLSATIELFKQIKERKCSVGIELSSDRYSVIQSSELIALLDFFTISNMHEWPISYLKKVIMGYWNQHFARRLLNLRSAAELVMFMRSLYFALYIILVYEKSKGNWNDTCNKWPQP